MNDHPPEAPKRSHPPLWLVEGIDIMQRRRLLLLAVAAAVILLAIILAATVPAIVPPVAGVGVAVGVAALLLGLAAAVAMDATDLRLRGPRHVGAAGGELVAVLPVQPSLEDAAPLAGAVLDARTDDGLMLLGLAASGREVEHTAAWTDMLGRALVERGVSVLTIDLATGSSDAPGLVEVIRDGVKLTQAVTFEPGKRLARLGAGGDHTGALESLATLPGRLPRDLDVLLVALPTAASRQVVAVVQALDHVLVVAERDKTSRVDLIAGLDALESAGTRAQVALLDDRTAARLAPPRPRMPTPTPRPASDPEAESASVPIAVTASGTELASEATDEHDAPDDVVVDDDVDEVDGRDIPVDERDSGQVGTVAVLPTTEPMPSTADASATEDRDPPAVDDPTGRDVDAIDGADADAYAVLAVPTDAAALAAAGQLTFDTAAERPVGGALSPAGETPGESEAPSRPADDPDQGGQAPLLAEGGPSGQDAPGDRDVLADPDVPVDQSGMRDQPASTDQAAEIADVPATSILPAPDVPLTQGGPVFVKPTGTPRPASPPRREPAQRSDAAVEQQTPESDPDTSALVETHPPTAETAPISPAVREPDQDKDDLLNTTVQLAGLKQDLARRLGESGGDGSGPSRSLPR